MTILISQSIPSLRKADLTPSSDRDTVNGDPEAGNTQPAVSPEVEEEVKQAIKEGEDQLKWDKGTINKPSMPDV